MTARTDTVIVGVGGFGREVLQWARDAVADGAPLNLVGFVDGDASRHGQEVHGLPVLGDVDWLEGRSGAGALVAVGSTVAKRRLGARIRAAGASLPTLVHPRAIVGAQVAMGEGTIVCPGAIITVDIVLGSLVTINIDVTIGHDARLGDHVTIAPGVHISGYVRIDEGVDVGTGVNIVPAAHVGAWSIVGAGAVVAGELPPDCTAVGVPAKVIKTRDAGWHLG